MAAGQIRQSSTLEINVLYQKMYRVDPNIENGEMGALCNCTNTRA